MRSIKDTKMFTRSITFGGKVCRKPSGRVSPTSMSGTTIFPTSLGLGERRILESSVDPGTGNRAIRRQVLYTLDEG